MAGSVNKVFLIGRLGRDPEVKSFQNGGRIANFSIATSESWKDRQSGERKERTEWHNISVKSDGLVGVVERFLKKGSNVFIEGKLQTRKWEKDGRDHYTTEVVLAQGGHLVMLGDPGNNNRGGDRGGGSVAGGGAGSSYNQGQTSGGGARRQTWDDDLDEEIPF